MTLVNHKHWKVKPSKDFHCACSNCGSAQQVVRLTQSWFKSGNERGQSVRTGTESGNLEGWLIFVMAAGVKLGSELLTKGAPRSCGKGMSNSCGPLSRKPPQPLCPSMAPHTPFPQGPWTSPFFCFASWLLHCPRQPWHGPGFQIFPFLPFLPYLLLTLKLFCFLGFYEWLQRNRLGLTSMGSYVVDMNFEAT